MSTCEQESTSKDTSPAEDLKGRVGQIDGDTAARSNVIYNNAEDEPEFHARTIIAVVAMLLLNFVQVFALQGPATILSYIGKDLDATAQRAWVPNALSLVQAVIGPVVSAASDTSQARKTILVVSSLISLIGAGIAPGSKTIGRLIAAQTLIGFGFATVPLAYIIPSEILPRRWRPACQGAINASASLGTITGILSAGGMIRRNAVSGWRQWYWVQFALWGTAALCIMVGYRPPKRYSIYASATTKQKVSALDLPGLFLLVTGLTLFLVGLNLGGAIYPWSDGRTLGTLISGIVTLGLFGLYEWKATRCGVLNHELFRGSKAFAICLLLIFVEGVMLFAFVIFYAQLTEDLFETDAFLVAARVMPFWVASLFSTTLYGIFSSRFRTIRIPLLVGFVLFTASLIGMATVQPGDSTSAVVFAGIGGLGFGAPLILIIAAVHLSIPHHLIATATAVTTSTRAIAATVFTASYTAAVSNRAQRYIREYVSAAVLKDGLPTRCVADFIAGLTGGGQIELPAACGLTPRITAAGLAALKQAHADSIRVVWIIAVPFGVVACVALYWLGDLSKTMDYRVEAPVEKLRARRTR